MSLATPTILEFTEPLTMRPTKASIASWSSIGLSSLTTDVMSHDIVAVTLSPFSVEFFFNDTERNCAP